MIIFIYLRYKWFLFTSNDEIYSSDPNLEAQLRIELT